MRARNVLGGVASGAEASDAEVKSGVESTSAEEPSFGTDAVPGGPVWNERGEKQDYDVDAQTRAVIENIKTVLEASGSSLDKVIDVQCFLIDMERDFKTFNAVYAEYFAGIEATRTTVAIDRLPTPIAVEFKVIAQA